MSAFLFSGGVSTVGDVFGGWFKQEIEDLIYFFFVAQDVERRGQEVTTRRGSQMCFQPARFKSVFGCVHNK